MNFYPMLSASLFFISLLIPGPVEVEEAVASTPVIPQAEVEVVLPPGPPSIFQVVMKTEAFAPDTKVEVTDLTGAFSEDQELVCPLTPGSYTVTVGETHITRFSLAENAAITNVVGCGWSDGEVLYLEPGTQWAIILKDGPLGVYEMTDGQNQWEQQGGGTVIFPHLQAGTYEILLPDGTSRVITLTVAMPQVTLGLA